MIKQTVVAHTMEHYSVIKRNELLIHTTTWMDLKGIILSEKSISEGYKMWFHLYNILKNDKIREMENRLVVAAG